MNPLFAQLALDWLEAEQRANPAEWPVSGRPSRDEMTVAIDRVYQVISGEVKWSEASPGDKAVWKSRVESVELFQRTWASALKRTPKEGEQTTEDLLRLAGLNVDDDPFNQTTPRPPRRTTGRLVGSRYRRWWNYYDTLVGIDHRMGRSMRVFNNENIGSYFLTNMHVAGQLGSDATFVIFGIRVAISSLEALHWAADHVYVQFIIGVQPALPPLFVRDLFRGVELVTPKARPLVIPVRQNFHANIELKTSPPHDLPPFDLVVHIEGLQTQDVQ